MKSLFGKCLLPVIFPLAFTGLTSCGIHQSPSALAPTTFLTSTGVDITQSIPRLPFTHSWRDPDFRVADYKNIIVRPVSTKYLRSDNWEHSKSTAIPDRKAYEKRANELARHFSKQLNIAFTDPICLFYKINDSSRPETLILEVVLTGAQFPDTSVRPLDVPICSFEARVTDAKTGKLLTTAADRRGPDLHIQGEDTHFTDNEEICSIWARQLLEASNKEIFENVRRQRITLDH